MALLEMTAIEKSFPGVHVLRGVDFSLHAGEVHVLLGENGAGKSTLMKILAGVHRPDTGRFVLDGTERHFRAPSDAIAAGIRTIYQELSVIGALTVAENLYLARRGVGRAGFISPRALRRMARRALEAVAPDIDPDTPTARLALVQRQRVEIAGALQEEGRILIMDEPTASLNAEQAATLFHLIDALRARGVAIIYITHRLDEIAAVGDRVTVLRDGRVAGVVDAKSTGIATLVELMVGAPAAEPRAPRGRTTSDLLPLLEVDHLSCAGAFSDVSLSVARGEIVSVAGVVGSGTAEFARALFGAGSYDAGTVEVDGRTPDRGSPRSAIAAGVGYVPDDRGNQGLILDASIVHNETLPSIKRFAIGGRWLQLARERTEVEATLAGLRLITPSLDRPARLLSGGNQQKLVIAKWLTSNAQVLILNEPTRGVDIASRREIYRLLAELAADGKAILIFSSDLEEVVAVSDRVVVMRRGRVVAELAREQISQRNVLAHAVGGGA